MLLCELCVPCEPFPELPEAAPCSLLTATDGTVGDGWRAGWETNRDVPKLGFANPRGGFIAPRVGCASPTPALTGTCPIPRETSLGLSVTVTRVSVDGWKESPEATLLAGVGVAGRNDGRDETNGRDATCGGARVTCCGVLMTCGGEPIACGGEPMTGCGMLTATCCFTGGSSEVPVSPQAPEVPGKAGQRSRLDGHIFFLERQASTLL